MAQQGPDWRPSFSRVKVYELRNNDWVDRGTGFCTTKFLLAEDVLPIAFIVVESEDQPDRLLLETRIRKESGFHKQQETLIVWQEYESRLDMAISFQEAEGCDIIWKFVQSRLNDTTEGTAQNRHTPRIEVSGEVPEVPTGYTLQLPIKPTAIQMQQVVYQNIQQNTLLLDSTAWQSKFSVNERMGKILDLITNITFAMGTPDYNRATDFGCQFEREMFHKSPTKESYDQAMANKTMDFFKKRQANEPDLQNSLNANAQARAYVQAHTQAQAEAQAQALILQARMSRGKISQQHGMGIPNQTEDEEQASLETERPAREAEEQAAEEVKKTLNFNIMMPADEAAKNHTANEITTLFNFGPNFESVTDSGYASLPTHEYKGSAQTTERNENQQFHSNGSDTNYTKLLGNEDQPVDDTGSVYTTGPDIPPSKKDAYISLLADDLLNKALMEKPDEESLDRICEALPRYLKTFAMKVGSSDSASIYRDVMVFVSRYRSEITNAMRDNYITETRVRSDVLDFDPVSNWHLDTGIMEDPNIAHNEKPDDVMDDGHYDDLDEADRATDSLPELSTYRDFISKHPAYEWLLQSIQKELYMGMPGHIQTAIRETILGYLPRAQRVSRRETPKRYVLTFTADWDPCSFLQEQEYTESPERAVERAITITGSKIDAQAATTTQYLGQTWPSSGIHLLHVVKRVVCDTNNISFSYCLPDKTQLVAWSQGPEFRLEVTGTAESIADIGEQLAWLGSALRSSPYETGVTVVGAFVSDMGTNSASKITEGQPSKYFCNLSFNLDVIDNTGEISNGQCWHQLFRNPVIVRGYPIPRRPMSNMGLEISLDIMASLSGTRYINTFTNKIFIKGFSAMLVPTRHSDNILLWHLVCKKNGDRVSYLDGKDIHADNVSLPDLETSRHILGWSSSVRYLVGSADANYNVDRSWLRGLHENCKLDGISISKSRSIKSNHEAAIGKRDLSPWIVRDPYRVKLDFLSKKYMVLWDVGCKRGWLVNGVNALLHLLRASLEFNKTDDLSFAFLFKSEMFKEARTSHTASAAMEVLINSANLDIELYEECEQDESRANIKFRVRDRINDLFETLEKTIDYQRMITGNRGEGLNSAPRKDVEGWDFKDIATNEDTIYPRLAKLKTVGKGWVDFTRAIEAVFLFGRDFGNLIDPIPDTNNSTCKYWETLPSNKYYLAASAKDLNTIMDRMGNPRANPPRLTNSLVWHPFKVALNTRCDCSTHAETHCEQAQAIWPLRISQPSPKSTPLSLTVGGAVVFGYSASIGWIWNDFGDPERRELPLLDDESDDDNSADSGIGLSLRSSTISESQYAGQSIHSLRHEHYKIAIICALAEELMAVRALFDETNQDLPRHESDTNTYALGRLGTHNVVAACLPSGDYGTNAASKVASDIEKSFPAVKWYFVVGIGGGIPSEEHDIRLGDVVVSTGVIQHDMGKVTQKGSKIKSTGFPQRPARSLLTAISSMQSDPSLTHNALEAHIEHIVSVRPEYQSPGEDRDKLFQASSKHNSRQKTCVNCKGPHVPKKPRPPGPHIHYGLIASGNQVIKDAVTRDRIGAELKVLCFEMEGAGVMATGNCLVIRGICDYADSHKNDEWHKYAAATAAAYTKLFLLRIRNLDAQNREVVQIQKRSVSSLEEDVVYLGKRARYLQE